MMSNTPRMFVGSTTFAVTGPASGAFPVAVRSALHGFPGVRVIDVDRAGGLLTVTTDHPVDRAELAAAISRAGCTVLA
jgi:hypothetical protein